MRQLMIGTLYLLLTLALVFPAQAGELDDYYLSRFGGISAMQLTAVGQVQSSINLPIERCGTPLVRGLRQDWPRLQAATQIVLAKQLAAPAQQLFYQSTHFVVHYAPTGLDSPRNASQTNANGIPLWVVTVADTFESVYATEVGAMGYKDPIPAGQHFDVYLQNIGSQYLGVTDSSAPAAQPYITIENDFAEFISSGFTAEQLLQITAAHEFHHAIQFAYTYWFDMWYAEASATWIEDEVYDGVNQLYTYLTPYSHFPGYSLNTPVSTTTGGGYGRWIFNRFLAEKYGVSMIRQLWEDTIDSAEKGSDINMLTYIDSRLNKNQNPSSLATEFEAFAKQLYLNEWTSHPNDLSRFPTLLMANYVSYPVNAKSGVFPGGSLQPYAFAAFSFTPPGNAGQGDLVLTLSSRTPGIKLALYKEMSSDIQPIAVDPAADNLTVASFIGGGIRKVVLLVINTSSSTGTISFSTDGSKTTIPVTGFPPLGTSMSTGTAIVAPVIVSSSSSKSCFIATAAYGSYLHPKVQVLRDFRDRNLLTNPLGQSFVAWYYRWSPGAARGIADRPLLRLVCRSVLTPLILTIEHPLVVFSGVFALASLGTCWRRRTVEMER